MTAHVLYPALDPARPATMSPSIIETVIRGAIGFAGALLSDDLSMGALSGSLARARGGARRRLRSRAALQRRSCRDGRGSGRRRSRSRARARRAGRCARRACAPRRSMRPAGEVSPPCSPRVEPAARGLSRGPGDRRARALGLVPAGGRGDHLPRGRARLDGRALRRRHGAHAGPGQLQSDPARRPVRDPAPAGAAAVAQGAVPVRLRQAGAGQLRPAARSQARHDLGGARRAGRQRPAGVRRGAAAASGGLCAAGAGAVAGREPGECDLHQRRARRVQHAAAAAAGRRAGGDRSAARHAPPGVSPGSSATAC